MITNMFTKKVLVVAVAGFVVFSVYGFLVHGILLQDMYNSLPGAFWRSEAESQALMHWIFIAYALMAWVLAILRPDDLTGVSDGFQRGGLIGVFLGSVNFINHAIMPMTMKATLVVFGADVVMIALVGAAMAFVAGKLSD